MTLVTVFRLQVSSIFYLTFSYNIDIRMNSNNVSTEEEGFQQTHETYGQKLLKNAYSEFAKPSHQQLLLLPILRFIFKISQPFIAAMGSILVLIVVLQIVCVVQMHFVMNKIKQK